MTILAGDIGGTKSNLGLFERDESGRPRQTAQGQFSTHDFATPEAMLLGFLNQNNIPASDVDAACLGVAGPVEDGICVADWLPWKRITETDIKRNSGVRSLWLINDMIATAYGVTVLQGAQLITLNRGEQKSGRNIAVIAAGTGLGESALIADREGRYHPMPAEGGHTDFAPRNDFELGFFKWVHARLHPVTQESVICGRGLVNLYTYVKWQENPQQPQPPMPADGSTAGDIAKAAAAGDPVANKALNAFLSAYGARAGNLAMQVMATGGVYIGGGIAPKNIDRIKPADPSSLGEFMTAFFDKGELFGGILHRIPVHVVMEQKTAQLGAAQYAMLNA